MIRKVRRQAIICALQIICVLAENCPSERNESVHDSIRNLLLDSTEYVASSRMNYVYVKILKEKSVDKTTKLDGEKFVLGDYPTDNNVDVPIFHRTIDDETFVHSFTSADGIKDRGNVQNLTIDSTGTEWIFLSWEFIRENETDKSPMYSIDVYLEKPVNYYETNDTKYNVTGLNACSNYTFTVKIIDTYVEFDGVNITGSTSDKITKIGDIRISDMHNTFDSIALKWDPPENNSACIQNYLITQCLEECKNVIVKNKEYTATNLESCRTYSFTIKAVTGSLYSNGVNFTSTTNAPKIVMPSPSITANAFALFIYWKPPKEGEFCIKHYRVNVTTTPPTIVEANGTSVTINNLYACTPYTVYVVPVDIDDHDGTMASSRTVTASTPSKSPVLYKEPRITKTDVTLYWEIEKGDSNCTLGSLEVTCNATTTTGHGYEVKNGKATKIINSSIHDESYRLESLVEDLSPFTTYICWAYVINEAGNSEVSNLRSVTTLEDIPSAPTIDVVNITYSQFIVSWETPKYLPGNLSNFELTLEWNTRFPIPKRCEKTDSNFTINFTGSTFSFVYPNATALTNYKARIKASTGAGWSNYSEDRIFETPAGVPGMVFNFSSRIENNKDDTNVLDTILTWGFPCTLNGILEYFKVSIDGKRINYEPHFATFFYNNSNDINENKLISMNLKELKAEYNYTFQVLAKVKGVKNFGVPAILQVLYPSGIPTQPDTEYVKSITIDPNNAQRTTTSVALLLPLFPETNGRIVYYSITVSRIGYNVPINTRFELTDRTWPNISTWEEAMLHDFTIPYQTTRVRWDPYPNHVADYGDVKAVKFTIGEDTNCKEISSNTDKRIYCNGPLKPNSWYHVRMRAFTRGGYSDSLSVFVIKTNAEIDIPLVTGVILGILFLGILTTMLLLARKCSPRAILRRFLHADMSGSPVPTPFSKKKFITHCQQLIDNPGKLSNEFQLLQTLSVDLQMPTNAANLQANKKKNRYSDILPYDFSRVKLEVIDNDPNTDYINASFIKGYTGEDEYIACQGPKEETTFDFWRMIEQYDIDMIVMLTELVEKGKEKCHQYFPTIRETFRYETMTIKCVSELDYRSYTQRTLVLQKENKKKNITHLHFKDWPDHDVPEDFDPMIHFCQIVRRNATANKRCFVIHCSAGIGRTGTFIALDIIIQHLRDNRKLDVFGTVYRLRRDRINMVQKESQYAYIYNCVKQVLKNPYCLKNYKPPSMDPLSEHVSKKTRMVPNLNTNLVNNVQTCM